ncbi:alpha,alpha-trehalase ATH1 Ecym_7120 [Eremothecium cymbalariae DBVPG|uniref:alpha,alpha-trehalase n=1 Tax=Eremothecium cymbalariae (strain CBS 270.75 / DBVPG 7215 / KCTC 17166 / NRRL Y-17582) TaxID=931890 RepID=G8JVV5_ERECY|nr:hypothetical protein Ecym_7120 [Eremothecium cymbalariae DBVPG\
MRDVSPPTLGEPQQQQEQEGVGAGRFPLVRNSSYGSQEGGNFEDHNIEIVRLRSSISVRTMVLSSVAAMLTVLMFMVALLVPTSMSARSVIGLGDGKDGTHQHDGWGSLLGLGSGSDRNVRVEEHEDTLRVEQHRTASKKLYEMVRDSERTFYHEEEQVLGSKLLSKNTFSRQPYVSNGYIGSRIPNVGFGYADDELNIWTPNSSVPGALDNGWPLRNKRYAGAFVSDFYSLQPELNSTNFRELDADGYSTVISSIPQWTELSINMRLGDGNTHKLSPTEVDLEQISGYVQNLSLANGIVSTEYHWLDTLYVKTSIVAHRKVYPLGLVEIELSLSDIDEAIKSENSDKKYVRFGKNDSDHSYNKNDDDDDNNNVDDDDNDNVDDANDGTNEYTKSSDTNKNGNDNYSRADIDDDDDFVLNLEIQDILNFTTSHRTVLRQFGFDDNGIYMVVEPDNVPYSNASIYSSWESCGDAVVTANAKQNSFEAVTQSLSVQLTRANPAVKIRKYVGIVSSEYNEEPISNLERAKSIVMENFGNYDALVNSHGVAWADLYANASIEIPSDFLLELAAKSSLYHLLANTRSHNISSSRGLPVPVAGLSSDSYGGMVFWDADTWMLPGILPFFPETAKQMANYRNATHAQAVRNARKYNYPGALYPWTSGRYANCTSTGPCVDYEYHINIDIAMSLLSIYMNGGEGVDDDYLRYTAWPIIRDAAEFFTAYVNFNDTLGEYTTHNMTDPDEFANFIDNGAFTNAGIKTLLRWAVDVGNHLEEPVDIKWEDISENIHIPTSNTNITLEYTGMNATVDIKQADVMLMVYPLGYITDESILNNAIQNLYYYSERQSASGPAMTYPVFAAAASTLLNHGCSSQSYLYKSVIPYLRSPFFQFSEQSDDNFLTNGLTQPAFPFLTANGGYLQSLLFGLTGLRYSYTVEPTSKKMERLLKFNPIRMPLLPGGIRIKNFKYLGQVLDISIGDDNATITHKAGNNSINVKLPDRSLLRDRDVPFAREKNSMLSARDIIPYSDLKQSNYYTVNPGDTLVLPVYRPGLNIQGNVAEGKQITNLTRGVPGDVAISMLDGNNYTHWQPFDKSERALLLIDLGTIQEYEITGGKILWGDRPAKNISLSILPHSMNITHTLKKLTKLVHDNFTEDSPVSCGDDGVELCKVDPEKYNTVSINDIDSGIDEIFRWNLFDVRDIAPVLPELFSMLQNFVTVLRDYEIKPSQPFFRGVYERSQIAILPSNETSFKIDYSKVAQLNPDYDGIDLSGTDTSWRKTRFVMVSVDGTYDDDDNPYGSTIKEIALM